MLGIPPAGYTPGERSDFALYAMQPETIRSDRLHSRSGWTPFEGREGVFPTLVIHQGKIAYNDGNYSNDPGRWVTGRGYLREEHIL